MSDGGTDLSGLLERRSFLLAVHGAVLGGGVIASCGSSISVTTTTQPGSIPTGSGTGNLSYPVEATGKGNLFEQSLSFSGTLGGLTLSGSGNIPAQRFFPTSVAGTLGGAPFTSQPVSVKFDVR